MPCNVSAWFGHCLDVDEVFRVRPGGGLVLVVDLCALWRCGAVVALTIQPRLQANIHKEDFSEELLSKSTRQAIRTARNKGIQIQFGGAELLDDFSALMKKTENRKNIHLRGKDYYQKLLDTYPDHSYITLSSIDLKARLEDLQTQLAKTLKEAEKFTEKTKPGKIENNQSGYPSSNYKRCLSIYR